MSNQIKTITISIEEYEELKEQSIWLNILREAGVDNWEGMSYVAELYQEYLTKDQEENV